MTSQERARLTELVSEMRKVAAKVGPLHGAWDTIFSIEALLDGREPIVSQSVEEWIRDAERILGII